jgi:hypothetical protein
MISNIWYYIMLFNLAGVITMFLYQHSIKKKLDILRRAHGALAEMMKLDVMVLYNINYAVLKELNLSDEQLAKYGLPPLDMLPDNIKK